MTISSQYDIVDLEMDCAGVVEFDKDKKAFTMNRSVKQLTSFQMPVMIKEKKKMLSFAEVKIDENET